MKNMWAGVLIGAAAAIAAALAKTRLDHEYVAGYAAGVESMVETRVGRAQALHDYLMGVKPELPARTMARIMRLALAGR